MKKQSSSFIYSLLLILISPVGMHAGVVSLTGGSLSITYDGAAFADTANSNFGLSSADGDFMRYGRYWHASETVAAAPNYLPKQPAAFRPLPFTTTGGNPRQPNFRDNRATLDPLYPVQSPNENLTVNGSGTIANSSGRNRIATTLEFDPDNLTGTVDGLVQTNGVSAWWFANNAIMNAGGSWVSWGDLSLRYDPTRLASGYSGWVFANQLGGIGDIFDTKITSMSVSASGLTLIGELYGSDGTSADPYNENYATWESYTLMNPNVKIGTFNFSGVTAIPEPGVSVLAAAALGLVAIRRRRTV
jgi:hypothetical protein